MADAATLTVLAQLLTLIAVGLIGCAVAERLGVARIVGGLIAGLLIGPSLLGNVAPHAHRWLWQGAQAELRQYTEARASLDRAIGAFHEAAPSEVYLDELNAQHLPRIAAAKAALERAEADHRRIADTIALFAMSMLLLAAGRNAPLRHLAALAARAVPIALGTVLVPAALAFAASWLLGPLGRGDAPAEAAATVDPLMWTIGLAVGCAVAALPLSARLVDTLAGDGFTDDADRQVPLLRCAAALNVAVAFAVAVVAAQVAAGRPLVAAIGLTLAVVAVDAAAVIGLAIAGLRLIRSERPDEPAWPVGFLFAVALAPILAAAALGLPVALGALVAGLAIGSLTHTPPLVRRGFAQIADAIALPILCAYIGTRIDLVPQFAWLWVLVALVVFADGKALGAALLTRLMAPGGVASPGWLPALRGGAVLAAGGALPLILAVLLRQSAVIDQPLFVALVIASAVSAALASPILRMIRQLESAPPSADADL